MIKRNEYFVFIDESGSINNKKLGIFEIAFLIIKKNNVTKLENYYKKKLLHFKKKNNISMTKEPKAHFLNKKYPDFIDDIFLDFLKTSKVVSGYVDNKKLILKKNANKVFFHMLQLIIERAKSRKFLQSDSILWIKADQRNNLKLEQKNLKNIVQKKHNIKIKSLDFLNSKRKIMIQIADIISFKCFHIILNTLKTKTKKPSIKNLTIREIYYK